MDVLRVKLSFTFFDLQLVKLACVVRVPPLRADVILVAHRAALDIARNVRIVLANLESGVSGVAA